MDKDVHEAISIGLFLTILLLIFLSIPLHYCFFIKPKEITYTSYITETKTFISTTTKIETSISITPTKVEIEDTISFYATGLYPNKEYFVGVHISKTGLTWVVRYTSDKNGEIKDKYYIGKNLNHHADDIDEFVIIDPTIPAIIAYTPLEIISPPTWNPAWFPWWLFV